MVALTTMHQEDLMQPILVPDGGAIIRVAIVEDDRTARDHLRLIIDSTPGYRCTQAFESLEDGLRGLGADIPDVVMLDVNSRSIRGRNGLRRIRGKYPTVQVMMYELLRDGALNEPDLLGT